MNFSIRLSGRAAWLDAFTDAHVLHSGRRPGAISGNLRRHYSTRLFSGKEHLKVCRKEQSADQQQERSRWRVLTHCAAMQTLPMRWMMQGWRTQTSSSLDFLLEHVTITHTSSSIATWLFTSLWKSIVSGSCTRSHKEVWNQWGELCQEAIWYDITTSTAAAPGGAQGASALIEGQMMPKR